MFVFLKYGFNNLAKKDRFLTRSQVKRNQRMFKANEN